MRKLSLLIFLTLIATSVALAANTVPTPNWGADELGAHNGYGRGCVMCHAPHGGTFGNGTGATGANADPYNGYVALWGENLAPYYGKTFTFTVPTTRSNYSVTLPAAGNLVNISSTESIVLLCLSCHDGNLATVSMMQNSTVETLPIVGGHAPTLFGTTPGNSGQNYYNEHPVGPSANVSCNTVAGSPSGTIPESPVETGYNWDCIGGGNSTQPIQMAASSNMGAFMSNNLSSFWNGVTYTTCTVGGTGTGACAATNTWGYTASGYPLSTSAAGTTVNAVTCTTCHNQHDMTTYTVAGRTFSTMFFIKGQYTPSTGGNSVAQFCRNCHGGNSNEMNGVSGVPTT